jgi:hypothetical protein
MAPPGKRRRATGLSPAPVWPSSHFAPRRSPRCWGSSPSGRSHNPAHATPARLARARFGQRPVSLATTPGVVLSPPATEMFQFAGFPLRHGCDGVSLQSSDGLPHSDTVGSQCRCHSPTLSRLSRVLHRLVVPRHPPTAHHVLPGLRFARQHVACHVHERPSPAPQGAALAAVEDLSLVAHPA